MLHFKKKLVASYKLRDDDDGASTSSGSSARDDGHSSASEANERCLSPPPVRRDRTRSPIRQVIQLDADMFVNGRGKRDQPKFNHNPEGPFQAATASFQKRPHFWPPQGPPAHLLLPTPHHSCHPYMPFPMHLQYPATALAAIPTLPLSLPPAPEPHRGLLLTANLPDLVIEQIKEEQQSPRPPSSAATFGNSSFSSSSPRSIGVSPTGSQGGRDGSTPPPTTQGSRRRRRQDTLVPEGCPLTRREIVDLAIDEFNELLEKSNFSEEQKAKFRDLRRKGKNRVAAKKSREKRISGIEHLKQLFEHKETKLGALRRERVLYEKYTGNMEIALEMARKKSEVQQLMQERIRNQSSEHR